MMLMMTFAFYSNNPAYILYKMAQQQQQQRINNKQRNIE